MDLKRGSRYLVESPDGEVEVKYVGEVHAGFVPHLDPTGQLIFQTDEGHLVTADADHVMGEISY